ncbi:MAG: DUF421 domain-containing protein [Bacilli bacterium]|nr:DUF421 domain-containing protein [Bacilli bacterium]
MNFFDTFLRSIFSIIVLFFLTKLMGRKQISQLNMYDYIVGITIGSVVAEISTNLDTHFLDGVIVMVVYTIVSILVSFLSEKSIILRRFLIGVPIILIENGKILEKSLKKSKFEINELLQEARINGYYDLSQIDYAIMEANGMVSFLPKSKYMPVTPRDLKLKVDKSGLVSNLVIDGKIMINNLHVIGKDKKWLLTRLNNLGYTSLDNILLVTCNNREKLTIYEKNIGLNEKKVLE